MNITEGLVYFGWVMVAFFVVLTALVYWDYVRNYKNKNVEA